LDFPALQRINQGQWRNCKISNTNYRTAERDERPFGVYVFEDLVSLAKLLHEHEIVQTITWIHKLIHKTGLPVSSLHEVAPNFVLGQLKEGVYFPGYLDTRLYPLFSAHQSEGMLLNRLYMPYRFDGKTIQSASEIKSIQALEQQSRNFAALF
jgi:hypothetical protein